jgi:hypothetical protein
MQQLANSNNDTCADADFDCPEAHITEANKTFLVAKMYAGMPTLVHEFKELLTVLSMVPPPNQTRTKLSRPFMTVPAGSILIRIIERGQETNQALIRLAPSQSGVCHGFPLSSWIRPWT